MKNKSNPVLRRRVAANRERARAKRSMLKRVAARWKKQTLRRHGPPDVLSQATSRRDLSRSTPWADIMKSRFYGHRDRIINVAKIKRRVAANRERARAKRSMLKRVAARWKKRAVKTPMQRRQAWTKGTSAGELRRRNNRDLQMARAVFGPTVGDLIEREGVPFTDTAKRMLATTTQGDPTDTLLKHGKRYHLAKQWHEHGLNPDLLLDWAKSNPLMNQERTDQLMATWRACAEETDRKMDVFSRQRARREKVKVMDDELPAHYRW